MEVVHLLPCIDQQAIMDRKGILKSSKRCPGYHGEHVRLPYQVAE